MPIRLLLSTALAPVALAWLSGCASMGAPPSYVAHPQSLALPPIVLYQEGTGPMSYHTATPRDVPHTGTPMRVEGEACQSGFSLPWAYSAQIGAFLSAGWGDGGYTKALTQLYARMPAQSMAYNVRADLRRFDVLSIWHQMCLVVSADVAPITPPGIGASPSP